MLPRFAPSFFLSGNSMVIIFCWKWSLAGDLSKPPQQSGPHNRVDLSAGLTRPNVLANREKGRLEKRVRKALAWEQAPQWGKKTKNGISSRAVAWGGERSTDPGDMPLMPKFHYIAPDSGTMPWLVKCRHVDILAVLLTEPHSFNITLLQFGRRFFKTRISCMQYNFLCETLRLSLGSRKSKWNMPVICCKKRKKHSKYRAFLILSCDKLRSHLQSRWLINRRSKRTAL